MSREGALWIGGLEPYMDEEFIRNALKLMGEESVISIKVIKNKFTGEPASYGFINFDSDPAALMAMHKLNGKMIPNSQPLVRFKLNHNSTRLMPGEKDHSIWVGDLSLDVDDLQLYRFFSARFQSIKSAKVVLDNTGASKGYGFIRFGNEQEQQTALVSMMGVTGLGAKPLKVSVAVPKSKLEGAFPSSLSSSSSHTSSAGGATNITTDNLPASALAVVVSNASGNPKAGAAVAAEANSQEYQQYCQQYWTQYAAWSQYSQQYYDQASMAAAAPVPPPAPAPVPAAVAPPVAVPPPVPPPVPAPQPEETATCENGSDGEPMQTEGIYGRTSIFEGEDQDLVEHNPEMDPDELNAQFMLDSEEVWYAMESSRWWQPDARPASDADEAAAQKIAAQKTAAKAAVVAAAAAAPPPPPPPSNAAAAAAATVAAK